MRSTDLLQPQSGWAQPASVRLPPPPPRERGALFRSASALSRLFGRPDLPQVFPVIHRNPRLFWAWLFFASRLMPWGRLPAQVREKTILRVAWRKRSRYEWGQHVEIALRVGVSDTEIVALTRPADTFTDAHDQLLMRACDQLCADKLIDDDTWQALCEHYSHRDLIELVMLVGHYEMVAGVLINAGIRLEPSVERTLCALYKRLEARPDGTGTTGA